jgi:hypothetical protein
MQNREVRKWVRQLKSGRSPYRISARIIRKPKNGGDFVGLSSLKTHGDLLLAFQ